jgi:hypothetical protein
MRYMVWDVCVVSGIRMCGIWYGIDVAYVWICVSCGMRCVWYSVYVCGCVCVCVCIMECECLWSHKPRTERLAAYLGHCELRCSEPKHEAHLQHGGFSFFGIHPGVGLLDHMIILFLVVLNYFKIMPGSAVLI